MKRALGCMAGWALALAVGCSSRAPAVAPAAAPAPAPSAAERGRLPEPLPRAEWAPPAPESWSLKNGNRVLFLPRAGVPLVSLSVVVPRGSETDPAARAGLTQLMADLMDEGAGARSALELSDALQQLATDVRVQAATDSVIVSMDLIAENFAPSVQILADIVRRPRLERAEFNRRKSQVLAQALANESEPRNARRVAMYRGLFGGGYAGKTPDGTRRTLEAITYEDVKAQYKGLVTAEGAQFTVSGGIERASVERELEQAFGDWSGKASVQARPVAAAPAPALYLVDFPGAAQSVLAVARRGPGSDTEDYFPAAVFNRSFGESFTSRVNLNLREDKGYTYGAFSTFVRFRRAGLLGIFADVKTETTRASLDEIFKELAAVCKERPLAAEERDTSVNGLLLGFPARFESVGLLGRALSEIIIENRPLDWFDTWPQRVEAVSLQAANEAAQHYCDRGAFSVALAADRAKVAPTLDGLGIKLVFLDAQGEPAK